MKKLLKFQNSGLRNFSSFSTSRSCHCDAHWGLRQISTGLRQPDLRRKCDFLSIL